MLENIWYNLIKLIVFCKSPVIFGLDFFFQNRNTFYNDSIVCLLCFQNMEQIDFN